MIADCHVHIFDPARFPYRQGTVHTPGPDETATLDDLRSAMSDARVTHAVLVGPMAGYATDNRCLVDALRRGGGTFRGIAVVDTEVSDGELDELAAAGVTGARFDLMTLGDSWLLTAGRRLLGRLLARGWLIDLQCKPDQLPLNRDLILRSGGRFLIDHAGRPGAEGNAADPALRCLLDLAASGAVWIKLSGPFRASREGPPFADMDGPFGMIARNAHPGRLLWGSDWPFVRSPHRPAYAATLVALDRWIPDPDLRRSVLEDNPAALFGWSAHG